MKLLSPLSNVEDYESLVEAGQTNFIADICHTGGCPSAACKAL